MLRFLKNELRWCSLKYAKSMNEYEYQLEKESYQRLTFRIFFTLLALTSFCLWLTGIGISNPFTPIRIVINISKLFSPILVHFTIKFSPNRIEEIIILFSLTYIFSYIEINRSFFSSLGAADMFFNGLIMQTLCVFFIIFRIRIIRLIIIFFLINMFISFRMEFSVNWFSFQTLILLMIAL